MIPRVVEVAVLEDYRLRVLFRDGTFGTVDLSSELWGPMFEPLRDKTLFARAIVHPELHTVTWPMVPTYLRNFYMKPPNNPLQRTCRKRPAAERKR